VQQTRDEHRSLESQERNKKASKDDKGSLLKNKKWDSWGAHHAKLMEFIPLFIQKQ
jgi:hypothetical protein